MKVKNTLKKKISHRCCKKGCTVNNRDSPEGTRFFCVPTLRQPLKSAASRKSVLINHAGAKMVVPSSLGQNSEPKTMSQGTGRDRSVRKILEKALDQNMGLRENEDWVMCAQKMAELACPEKHRTELNSMVAAVANIPLKKGNVDDYVKDNKLFRVTPVTKTRTYNQKIYEPPVVQHGMRSGF
mmetsp:Transcript_5746/g.10891  ORF Transcript_5746/g.10891 Transcript_5746/m.10891 type:complete len:183 (+) Transcript_5746:2639-3187(+)